MTNEQSSAIVRGLPEGQRTRPTDAYPPRTSAVGAVLLVLVLLGATGLTTRALSRVVDPSLAWSGARCSHAPLQPMDGFGATGVVEACMAPPGLRIVVQAQQLKPDQPYGVRLIVPLSRSAGAPPRPRLDAGHLSLMRVGGMDGSDIRTLDTLHVDRFGALDTVCVLDGAALHGASAQVAVLELGRPSEQGASALPASSAGPCGPADQWSGPDVQTPVAYAVLAIP
jgi:hypothetical protein